MRYIASFLLFCLCLLNSQASGRFDIRDFGAVPDDDSLYAEEQNAIAIMEAFTAANYTSEEDREVYVPAGMSFNTFPVYTQGIKNLTLTIDGTLKASKRNNLWTLNPKDGKVRDMIYFKYMEDLKIQGTGSVDGQGYMWWVREYIGQNHHGRPKLLRMDKSNKIEVTGVKWVNSPSFHIYARTTDTSHYHDFEIEVDAKGQLELNRLFKGAQLLPDLPSPTLPMYALNTDGLDPNGSNILIERLNITSYDDAIAIKGIVAGKYELTNCTENVMIRDINVYFSTGLTIGSVIPNGDSKYQGACVRNVTFKDSKVFHPFKGIYIKNNPDTHGEIRPAQGGMVSDITYENIEIHNSMWWPIYIGPQQQNQPGSDPGDPGCLLYPLVSCDTNPEITFKDFTLRNINVYNSVFPGLFRCSELNPCTGMVFDNVNFHGAWWQKLGIGYITENVYGNATDSKPDPSFITQDGDGFVNNDNVPQLVNMLWENFLGIFKGTNVAVKELKSHVETYKQAYKAFTQ